jgi:hypothetical protein
VRRGMSVGEQALFMAAVAVMWVVIILTWAYTPEIRAWIDKVVHP